MEKQSDKGIRYFPKMHRSDIGKGFPPPPDKRVTLENWTATTAHWRFMNLNPDVVFKNTHIEQGDAPVWVLPRKMIDPERLLRAQVLWDPKGKGGARIPVADWLKQGEIDALVALHDGHIVAEIYCGEMTPQTRHHMQCGSKSFLATAMAPYLINGTLDEQAEVTEYVPEFSGTAFRGARLRHLLDMSTGVAVKEWIEPEELAKLDPAGQREWAYGSPEFRRAQNDFARSTRASGDMPRLPDEPTIGFYDFILSIKEQEFAHGKKFVYRDSNNMAAQLVLERATQTPYLSHLQRLFDKLGFERDAIMRLDPIGSPVSAFGLFLAPRDYARWGQMLCSRGQVANGQVLPGIPELVDDILRHPGPERLDAWLATCPSPIPNLGYRSFCWTHAVERGKNPVIEAAGAWIQKCQVDVARKNVLVVFSSFWPEGDPQKIQNKITPDHGYSAIWSFMDEVLPELTQ